MSTSDVHRPFAPHDLGSSHDLTLPREGARSLVVLSVAAAFCVVLFLALSAIGPNAAGASEPESVVSTGSAPARSAVVCDMGDGVVTTTEGGQTIEPAFCEVDDPATTGAEVHGLTAIGAVEAAGSWTSLSTTAIDTAPVGTISANGFSFGWQPGFGAAFVAAIVAVRVIFRLIRRRRTFGW